MMVSVHFISIKVSWCCGHRSTALKIDFHKKCYKASHNKYTFFNCFIKLNTILSNFFSTSIAQKMEIEIQYTIVVNAMHCKSIQPTNGTIIDHFHCLCKRTASSSHFFYFFLRLFIQF